MLTSPSPGPAAQTPRSASPAQKVFLFYLFMFPFNGALAAYGGIWMKQQGFSELQIGMINAVPIGLLIVLNLWIGRIADRADDWKDAIRLLAFLTVLGPAGLFLFDGFWPVLACVTVLLVAHGLMLPVADAAVMRLGKRENIDFAVVRAFGTIGYIVTTFLTGFLTAQFGPVVFLPILLVSVLVRAALSNALPRLRGPKQTAQPGARRLSEVMKPWFLLPLAGWSLIYGALAVLGPFQALLWEGEGISPYWIVTLVAVAPIAETALFLTFRHFAGRFRARHLILASAIAMVLRLIGFALEPGPFWLVPLQMLHALTYTLGFLGCVTFIANWTSEDIAAEAQSFFVVLQQICTAAMLLLFGWLSQSYGAQAYLALAVFCTLGAVMIAGSLKLREPARDAG